MTAKSSSQEDHHARSNFVRSLVQQPYTADCVTDNFAVKAPKTIVQFWDNPNCLPTDVLSCIKSWNSLKDRGIELYLFDYNEARTFISKNLSERYLRAYSRCYHPAMQSDYFRLCYLLIEGGCYIDADEIYHGIAIDNLFEDGRLKIQPLCYDTATGAMVCPTVFTKPGANSETWIFYFNNNPLIAMRGHPIIRRALVAATEALEQNLSGKLPEIQSTTGPGNLTKSIVDHAAQQIDGSESFCILHHWEDIATSKWPLSYRHDSRNWRLSNQQPHPSLTSPARKNRT